MSGFVVLMSPCIGCGNPFSYNPHRVPSVRIDGERQPVCRSCVDRVNPRREANGLDPIVIQPGAYDAMPEEEL